VDTYKSLQLILNAKGDPNATYQSAANNNMGLEMEVWDTPLVIAVRDYRIRGKDRMQSEVVRILLEGKANPNSYDHPSRKTILHLAAARPSTTVLQQLIDAGAHPNLSVYGESALHVALRVPKRMQLQTCLTLITHCKEYINTADEKGIVPLIAFFHERTKWPHSFTPPMISSLFQALFEAGAQATACDSQGYNAAHLASNLNGQGEMTRAALGVLVEGGVPLDARSERGDSIMQMFNLNVAAVDFVLREGSLSVNDTNSSGKTALHIAVERNRLDMVTHLLSKGIDTRIQDNDGHDALHYIQENGNDSTMRVAKQIKSKIQTARKRKIPDGAEEPISKVSKLSLSSIIPERADLENRSLLYLPLEILFEIFEYLEPHQLVKCELICKGWNDILHGPDGNKFWKRYCERFFWLPKGGWDLYLEKKSRGGVPHTVKGFYQSMLACTCRGCGRRTGAVLKLFNELVCLGCRFRLDKYYYYTATELIALQLTKEDIRGCAVYKQNGTFRKATCYRAVQIEPIVFGKYGQVRGAKKLLSVSAKRPLSRNFNHRVQRLFGIYEHMADEVDHVPDIPRFYSIEEGDDSDEENTPMADEQDLMMTDDEEEAVMTDDDEGEPGELDKENTSLFVNCQKKLSNNQREVIQKRRSARLAKLTERK